MKRFLTSLLIFTLYVIAACVITYPLVTALTTHFLGHPFGDSTEYAGHIAWIVRALHTGQNPFFQPLLVYPHGLSALWLWAVPLQSFPTALLMLVFSLFLPESAALPLAFNLSALLTIALNGLSMYALVHSILRRTNVGGQHAAPQWAAFLAGLIYMSFPAFQGHMGAGHIGLLALWGAPLCALFMLRIEHHNDDHSHFRARRADMIGAAVGLCASGLGSTTLLIYLTLPILLVLLWQSRHDRRALTAKIGAVIGGGALLMIFVMPFVFTNFMTEFSTLTVRLNSNSVQYSAPLMGIVSPSPQHPLYRALDYPGRVIGGEPFENTAYLGVIGGVLALIGVIRFRSARVWLIMALAVWVLSLGALLKIDANVFFVSIDGRASPVALPYALVQALPLVDFTRTPARFDLAIGFAAAILAGYGAASLIARVRQFALPVTIIAAALILFDVQTWWSMPLIAADIPAPIADLSSSGAQPIRAVFDVPFDHPLVDKEALYLQSAHGLPILGGHIARETLIDPAMGAVLQATLDPALLNAAGADVIVLHRDWDDPDGVLEANLHTHFGDPVYADARFAVFRVPPYVGDPPGLVQFAAQDGTPTSSAAVYVVVPNDGSYTLTGQVSGAVDQGVRLTLDSSDVSIVEWSLPATGTTPAQIGLRVPISLTAGYHMLHISLDPPCIVSPAASLVCPTIQVSRVSIETP